jgi:shikimate kinase
MSVLGLVGRLIKEKSTRPLIAHLTDEELPEFIGKHLFERMPYYTKATWHISVDGLSPQEVLDRIRPHIY